MSETMKNRTKKDSLPIEIPPLPLGSISIPESAVKLKASKDPITFLKNTGLDHNAEFLK